MHIFGLVFILHIIYNISLVETIIRHQKLHQACRELPTVALPHDVKIRENYQRQE